MWEARATYEDGTEVCEYFPYREEGNYTAENKRQYELEAWLLGYHDNCTWYSVTYVEE